MASYKQCIAFNPNKLEPLLELASLFMARGKPEKSLEWLEGCLSFREREQAG